MYVWLIPLKLDQMYPRTLPLLWAYLNFVLNWWNSVVTAVSCALSDAFSYSNSYTTTTLSIDQYQTQGLGVQLQPGSIQKQYNYTALPTHVGKG